MGPIEFCDPATLRPHPQNPRIGSVPAIAASIRAHGWYGTVIVQRSTGTILAGAHRVLAAREEGIAEIPVYYVDVDDEQALAILLGDNKIADLGGYDPELLLDLVGELDADLRAVTGYDDADIRALSRRLDPVSPSYSEPSAQSASAVAPAQALDASRTVDVVEDDDSDSRCPVCGR